jgi:hypothetical protein
MTFCIWWIITKFSSKIGTMILIILVLIQFFDLSDYFLNKGYGFKQKITWETKLPSPVWKKIMADYQHIFFLQEHPELPKLYSFLYIVAEHTSTVNDTYLARRNTRAVDDYKQKEKELIKMGDAKVDTVYVFQTIEEVNLFTGKLHFYMIDDMIIGVKFEKNYIEKYRLKIKNFGQDNNN